MTACGNSINVSVDPKRNFWLLDESSESTSISPSTRVTSFFAALRSFHTRFFASYDSAVPWNVHPLMSFAGFFACGSFSETFFSTMASFSGTGAFSSPSPPAASFGLVFSVSSSSSAAGAGPSSAVPAGESSPPCIMKYAAIPARTTTTNTKTMSLGFMLFCYVIRDTKKSQTFS